MKVRADPKLLLQLLDLAREELDALIRVKVVRCIQLDVKRERGMACCGKCLGKAATASEHLDEGPPLLGNDRRELAWHGAGWRWAGICLVIAQGVNAEVGHGSSHNSC